MQNETNPGVLPEEHLGLVHLCAKRFRSTALLEYDDLFQAGCEGLVKAAERFDPARGLAFSTYAVPMILGEMRGLFRNHSTVHLSRGIRDLGRRARAAEQSLQGTLGCAPTVQEIAARLGERPERVAQALDATVQPISLTTGEGGEELCLPVEAPEAVICERISLVQSLQKLPEQDRRLIEYRYFQQKTQVETAALLSMTQVQVSRREKKILLVLRENMAP